jgi:predicted ABC-type exoprotein transport system permease subunit
MLSAFVIALLVALSTAAWVYSKTMRRSGGNNQSSLTVSIFAGVAIFIITLTVVSLVNNFLE